MEVDPQVKQVGVTKKLIVICRNLAVNDARIIRVDWFKMSIMAS